MKKFGTLFGASQRDYSKLPVETSEEEDWTSDEEDLTSDEDNSEIKLDDLPKMRPLNIVMLIVGTRGDVQPFVAIGEGLKRLGHKVRLATHANEEFKELVTNGGLEFHALGGDAKVLADYMARNKGFLPDDLSEIPAQRKQIIDIVFSLREACTDGFEVDAIIANPPAYGHTHVAEALGVPVHVFFTMPWTPTSQFAHPLSSFPVKCRPANKISYTMIDFMIWSGIRNTINDFRKKELKLPPMPLFGGQGSASDVPYAYIWSPYLVPKPSDWGPRIDVVGFCYLKLASTYRPKPGLEEWLKRTKKRPIYIGFGSLGVKDPNKITGIIVKALQDTRQRGIISQGWGGFGKLSESELKEVEDFVYVLDKCPHDWLFPKCKAVVHHGGAGTTAAGLKAGRPTTIVPFFGDQPFWGEQVRKRGVGPAPIPIDKFSLNKLTNAINFMRDPMVKKRAKELAKEMGNENGVKNAIEAFYKQLPEGVKTAH